MAGIIGRSAWSHPHLLVRRRGHLLCRLVATISAVDYFIGFWKQIDHASKGRRKASVLSRGKSVRIS